MTTASIKAIPSHAAHSKSELGKPGQFQLDGEAQSGRFQPSQKSSFVYHGSADGLLQGQPVNYSWTEWSDQLDAHHGWSVGTAGDVNGDGYSDVIVGAPYYAGSGGSNEGRVWVFYGSEAGVVSSGYWSRRSGQGGAYYGYSVATAGDVNGDGRADILIRAPLMTNSISDEGLVRLYLSPDPDESTGYAWTAAGGQTLSWYGVSVGSAGDVNGDGYAEAIIGADQTAQAIRATAASGVQRGRRSSNEAASRKLDRRANLDPGTARSDQTATTASSRTATNSRLNWATVLDFSPTRSVTLAVGVNSPVA